ncbi:MAG: hypothetical protein IJJ26_12560 [Victivallales bacterium]|nr:hypothetical protein [Victivallales bacterium]
MADQSSALQCFCGGVVAIGIASALGETSLLVLAGGALPRGRTVTSTLVNVLFCTNL